MKKMLAFVAGAVALPVVAIALPQGGSGSGLVSGPRPGFEEPQMHSAIAASPAEIRLEFKEGLDPRGSDLVIRNSRGVSVGLIDSTVSPTDDRLLTVGVDRLPADTYTVQWRATGASSHRTSRGSYPFVVYD